MTKLFGLIGYPLTHSFSKKYFSEKFEKENIQDHHYELFEIKEASEFLQIIRQNPNLQGLNVTIPHKQSVIPLLDVIDEAAAKIGAVNVIKVLEDGRTKGFNSDYFGFKQSLEQWPVFDKNNLKALILGNGGAAKAVKVALQDLGISYQLVSRTKAQNQLSYQDLSEEIIRDNRLIINTSPVGTFPNIDDSPDIPYQFLTSKHLLYDLVYNPLQTQFMAKGIAQGASAINGLPMLHFQAEKAWEIWQTP